MAQDTATDPIMVMVTADLATLIMEGTTGVMAAGAGATMAAADGLVVDGAAALVGAVS